MQCWMNILYEAHTKYKPPAKDHLCTNKCVQNKKWVSRDYKKFRLSGIWKKAS